MTRSWLRIGEVAKQSGVSVGAIRYYEKRKLLRATQRSEGGFRLFAADAIERVRFIKQAQELGFSLDEIRMLVTGGDVAVCGQIRDLLRVKLDEINERMRSLREFTRTLSRHLQACENELTRRGDAAKCPVALEIIHKARRELVK